MGPLKKGLERKPCSGESEKLRGIRSGLYSTEVHWQKVVWYSIFIYIIYCNIIIFPDSSNKRYVWKDQIQIVFTDPLEKYIYSFPVYFPPFIAAHFFAHFHISINISENAWSRCCINNFYF